MGQIARDQIITKWNRMTPRERDAWVAEVVFGWKTLGDGRVRSSDGFMIRAIPEYTTDISAAWAIVEESARWGGMEIGCYASRSSRWHCVSTQTDTAPYQRRVSVTKDSAPEAIGLAAIIAKLVTEVAA
ncbi:hypothetical protein NYE48_27650 [Paenibacillus sp. FSL M7-1455]|uniref:BC1872 family protein n=1 Tax=Paenibacillus sp. FSL M7-1455 TaxID=2975316 RepID=UPI0030F8F082